MTKAYVFTANGGPEVEAFVDLPDPVPGPGQVLIAVKAAGVNPADWKRRAGSAPAFPVVFGNEAAGVVEAVGEGVSDFGTGDEVFGNPASGGYTERTLLPVATTALKPPALSFVDAATIPVAGATAYDGLVQLGLAPGSILLVTGLGGGVGVATAQIARHLGLNVIGTAGAAKKDLAESLGATHVEYGPGVVARIAAAAPGGVDGVFDLVGGDALREVAPLAPAGKLITAAGANIVGELGGEPVARTRNRATLEAVAQLVVDGVLDPKVTATYPFDEAPQALRSVEEGHATGKIVLVVDQ